MITTDLAIIPVAAMIRQPSGGFVCKVRWLMGSSGDRLPSPADRFEVRLVLTRTQTTLLTQEVAPQNYAMIDPPRRMVTADPDTGLQWNIAVPPSKPVDLICWPGNKPEDEGLGVYQLLCGPQPYRVEEMAHRLLSTPVAELMDDVLRSQRAPRLSAEDVSRHLARTLVRGNHRPVFLRSLLPKAYEGLWSDVKRFMKADGSVECSFKDSLAPLLPPPSYYSTDLSGGGMLVEMMRYATSIIRLYGDRQLLEELDPILNEPSKLRSQIRCGSLVGGELLDYWCSPMQSIPPDECTFNQRARAYPGSELIGLGVTLGDFTDSTLREWVDNEDSLRVEVHHTQSILDHPEQAGTAASFLWCDPQGEATLDPGRFVISGVAEDSEPGIRRALLLGSSIPPLPPQENTCRINYDMMQSDAGAVPDPSSSLPVVRQLGFGTGDARIEIHIGRIDAPEDKSKHVAGFNVYGVWETSETQHYFGTPGQRIVPPLAELKKWLITRRHSFERDLRGAFPDILSLLFENADEYPLPNDALDPRLATIVAPPCLAQLERAARITDDHPEAENELPTGSRPDANWFTIDLRAGMKSGHITEDRRLFVGWDPEGLIDESWTPELSRDGRGDLTHPQRYRFWVTSYDSFEQESDPIPVVTHDVDAGETISYEFAPRRRSSILSPDNCNVRVTNVDETFDLTVEFETPFFSQMGQHVPTGDHGIRNPQRVNRQELLGHIVVFRRPLRTSGGGDKSRRLSLPASPIFSLPQWVSVFEKAQAEGWEQAHVWEGVRGSDFQSDTWAVSYNFGHQGRGYEYRASVGVSVRGDSQWQRFWMPIIDSTRELGRTIRLVDEKGEPEVIYGTEAPSVTPVSESEPFPLVNPDEPIAPTPLSRPPLLAAAPILPPPGISRDLILMRLLSFDFSGDTPVTWRDTDVQLNYGQTQVLDATLERTIDRLPGEIDLDHASLRIARKLLAADFRRIVLAESEGVTATESPSQYQQHLSIGFRGLVLLDSLYDPTSLSPTESTAVSWVLSHVRIDLDPVVSKTSATFISRASLVSHDDAQARYRLVPAPDLTHEGLESIIGSGHSCLVRIDDQSDPDSEYEFLDLLEVTTGGDFTVRLGTLPESTTTFPQDVELTFYLANPLIEQEIPNDRLQDHFCQYLPVGGGPKEIMCWWLGTRSAMGRESKPENRQVHYIHAARTTPPSPVKLLRTDAPLPGPDFALAPSHFSDWIPADLTSLSDAIAKPRVILGWQTTENDPEVKLMIERRERASGTNAERCPCGKRDRSPWRALIAIASARDDEELNRADADQLRHTWLMGHFVETDASLIGSRPIHIGYPEDGQRHLSAQSGLKTLQIGSDEDARPSFIDYFQHREQDRRLVMDGNLEYQYRATAYVLVDASPQTPMQWRYLASEPTPWTEFVRPETSNIRVQLRSSTTQVISDLGPHVVLNFEAPAARSKSVNLQDALRYRLTVRRRRDFSIQRIGKTQDPGYAEVGAAVALWPGQSVELQDADIERSEIDSSLTLEYEIFVQQFRADAVGNERTEELVRGLPRDEHGNTVVHREVVTIDPVENQESERAVILTYDVS